MSDDQTGAAGPPVQGDAGNAPIKPVTFVPSGGAGGGTTLRGGFDLKQFKESLALLILALGAVPAPAYLIGWLAANGQTFAMATVLTLIVGLLAYFGLKPPAPPGRAEAAIVDASASPLTALIATAALWALSLAWMRGLVDGKRPHTPELPPVAAALATVPAGTPPAKASLRARLAWLRMTMQSKGRSSDEFVGFVNDVVVPLVAIGEQAEAEKQIDWFTGLLSRTESPRAAADAPPRSGLSAITPPVSNEPKNSAPVSNGPPAAAPVSIGPPK